MKKTLAILLALAMVFALSVTAFADDVIELKLADNGADNMPNVIAARRFAELAEEYTNGTVKVEVYSNGVLGDEASVADQLQLGTLDMARISVAGMAPSCQTLKVASMPYLFTSDQAKYDAFDGEFGQALTDALLEDTGIVNLTYFFATARSFYTVEKQIHSVADMAGLKIRSQEDPIVMAMFEALGAKATPMNYSEVYSALETKIVDGAENDMTSYYTSGHYEVAPYYSLDKHTALGSLFCMSAKAWASLSAEQQEQVKKAAYEASLYERELLETSEAESRAAVEAGGAQIIEVDIAEFQEACQAVYDKYPEFADLIALIK